MPSLRLHTPPTKDPLHLSEVKQHLRVEIGEDDPYLLPLVTVATEQVEKITNRALCHQTWELWLDAFPRGDDAIALPRPPLVSVDAVEYWASDGQMLTVDASDLTIDMVSENGHVFPNSCWPSAELRRGPAVCIRFTAGYSADGASVPRSIRHAMLLLIGDLYENRENTLIAQGVTVIELPMAVKALLRSYRVKGF